MTNQANLAVVISASDRASPVMRNVSQSMQQMGSRALSSSTAIGALSSSASGLGQAFVPLLGGLGPAAIAIAAVSTATALGIKRFQDMRTEAREVRKAQQDLGTTLLLNGLSATSATAQINELRTTFDRLSFQALPRLTGEMQIFLATLDQDSLNQVNKWAEALESIGVEPKRAIEAAGEAMRGNFGPISELLGRPINSFAELEAAMTGLTTQVTVQGSAFLSAMQDYAEGRITFEELSEILKALAIEDLPALQTALTNNKGIIAGILNELTPEDITRLETVFGSLTDAWGRQSPEFKTAVTTTFDDIRVILGTAKTDVETHTTDVGDVIDDLIAFWEKLDPAVAEELRGVKKSYDSGYLNAIEFEHAIKDVLADAAQDHVDYADEVGRQVVRVEGYMARMRAAVEGPAPTAAGPTPGVPIAPVRPTDDGGFLGFLNDLAQPFTDAFNSVFKGSGSNNSSQPLVIQIGDQPFAQAVVEVIDGEIRIREPGLGLG